MGFWNDIRTNIIYVLGLNNTINERDKEEIAFTIKESLESGNYRVIQGLFNTHTENIVSSRVSSIDEALGEIHSDNSLVIYTDEQYEANYSIKKPKYQVGNISQVDNSTITQGKDINVGSYNTQMNSQNINLYFIMINEKEFTLSDPLTNQEQIKDVLNTLVKRLRSSEMD